MTTTTTTVKLKIEKCRAFLNRFLELHNPCLFLPRPNIQLQDLGSDVSSLGGAQPPNAYCCIWS